MLATSQCCHMMSHLETGKTDGHQCITLTTICGKHINHAMMHIRYLSAVMLKIRTFNFFSNHHCYHNYYSCFTTLCLGLLRWVGTRRINYSGFCWSRNDGVAVASAELFASYLHFGSEDNHASTSSVRFLRAGCPSWHPTNSVKALKKNYCYCKPNPDPNILYIKQLQGIHRWVSVKSGCQ